jgi:hypothetical protein
MSTDRAAWEMGLILGFLAGAILVALMMAFVFSSGCPV